MNSFKNYVFIDSDSFELCPSVDIQSNLSAYDVEIVQASHRDVPLEFSEIIRKKSENSEIRNYVVLTQRPTAFHEQFISNNIIETSLPKKFTSIMNEVKWVFDKFGGEKIRPSKKIFLTSDTHFWHKNIIKYCNRPWNSGIDSNGEPVIMLDDIERMNEAMIQNWNAVVGPDDTVYHLGDVLFGDKTRLQIIMQRLNGHKRLVLGNHDSAPGSQDSVRFYMDSGFERVYDRSIVIQDFIILSHFPMSAIGLNSPFYNCYGHVHNSSMFETWTKNGCCVCVERHDYTPVSLDIIKAKYEEMNA